MKICSKCKLEKSYFAKGHSECKECNKIYRLAHKKEIKKKNTEYYIKISKNGFSSSKYLPYPIDILKKHLESQFEIWMNWSNHGKYDPKIWRENDMKTWTWQIDHIIPQSILPYTAMKDDNFKKCWALDNLRPLSAKMNVLDGNRI